MMDVQAVDEPVIFLRTETCFFLLRKEVPSTTKAPAGPISAPASGVFVIHDENGVFTTFGV